MKWNAVEHVAWNPKKGKDPVLFLLFTSFHVHLDSILNSSKIFQHEKKHQAFVHFQSFLK